MTDSTTTQRDTGADLLTTDADVEGVRANVLPDDGGREEPADPAADLPVPATIDDPVERAHVRRQIATAREQARANTSDATDDSDLRTTEQHRAAVRDTDHDNDD